jgi:DMSO reductase anchor subunit
MHPALSVILFTTASGAGYGLLALLGVLAPLGLLPDAPGFGAIALGTALVLVSAGLLASTAHLGHPERAWRAFSQWRTSWLSREGVAALATYLPAGLRSAGSSSAAPAAASPCAACLPRPSPRSPSIAPR